MKDITDEQKEKALKMAYDMANRADDEKIEEASGKIDEYKDKKALSAIWDKLKLLNALIKNPHLQRSLFLFSISAILYLVSPLDVIPDIIPFVGFIDDVAVIMSVFPLVINGIKKKPEIALKIYDSLPEDVKKIAYVTLGIAGGAVGGGILGSKIGEELKDVKLHDLYMKATDGEGDLKAVILSIREKLYDKVRDYIRVKLEKYILDVFGKKYLRGLEITILFLSSLLFSLSPLPYNRYISSSLLFLAYFLTFLGVIRFFRFSFPYVKSIVKNKSVYKGIETRLLLDYEALLATERVLSFLNMKPDEDDVKYLVRIFIKAFRKQLILSVLGILFIGVGFYIFRRILFEMFLDLSPLEILFYPFFNLF